MFNGYASGWAIELRLNDREGGVGMWQCILGRESVIPNYLLDDVENLFRSLLAFGVPDFLHIPEVPGDADLDILDHLCLGPATQVIFSLSAEDRRSLKTYKQREAVEYVLTRAENVIDGFLEQGDIQKYRPVAGPAALWRLTGTLSY